MRPTPLIPVALFLFACGASSPSPASSPQPDPSHACTSDAECTLVARPCCDPCSPWTQDDFDAVRADHATARRLELCPEPAPCPECVSPAPDANIRALCPHGACIVTTIEPGTS